MLPAPGKTALSKTLDLSDYDHLGDEISRIGHARNMFAGCFNTDHEHRTWEYAMCLTAVGLRETLVGKHCLDVGGGYSILPGLLAWSGAHVVACEVSDHRAQQEEMGRRALDSKWGGVPGGSFRFMQGDFAKAMVSQFDLVTCVSVIEHAENDRAFFQQLLRNVAPGGTLVLTTDFHPSGQQQTTAHNRAYNERMLKALFVMAVGFESPGGFDYPDRGGPVFGYNFASLVLRRGA